ncbi:Valencene synthase [Melia azedarach]|uniref:Valencene synthase n=1 Tax=Melia azedarach TaxID=155640 RepID=A0ACC1X672_MELAZ|nr:Valencene synthase [Melia azedarach]
MSMSMSMSLSTQGSADVVPNSAASEIRRCADFHPSVWGDYFLTCPSETIFDTTTKEEYETLKEEVRRRIIAAAVDKPVVLKVLLQLIDTIQRLGVAYHFGKEIEDVLVKIFETKIDDDDDDLCTVSLRFRLLRQQGINISSDVFNEFKDEEGKYFFKESLIENVEGLLSLYEAAYLGVRGEKILDEALAFTTTQLKSISMVVDHSHPNLAQQINHALHSPLRKGVPRLETRYFLDIYGRHDLHDQILLKFAKLDFNFIQAQHKKELNVLTRWWKDSDFTTNVSYARDRLVESYFWILEMYSIESKYAFARIMLTKIFFITSIIDDTFDAYATFEEIQLFTEAIKRWDIGATDMLPEYMKIIYKLLLNFYNEIEKELAKEGRSQCIHYAIKKTQELIEMYFAQAKWFNEGYIPTSMEEYTSIAFESIGTTMLIANCYLFMGDLATEDAYKWILTNPKIVTATSIAVRLMDDIAGHEFEQKRGHIASAVECYMKQYGVSKEEAVKVLKQEVANAWKDMNEGFILISNNNNPSWAVSFPLLESILNFVRACDFIYKDGERYTHPYLMKDQIASVLKDPVIL